MTKRKDREVRNLPASVHDRLLTLAREQGILHQEALQYFAMERFLFRLSRSRHARDFVLKGALMLRVWHVPQSRLTRDIDLLGFTDNTTVNIAAIVRDVCLTPVVEDGLVFDADSVAAEPIRERADYTGIRATLTARLGKSVLPMQIDVGFADVITPAPQEVDYPVLLDFPAPRLRGYPRETTVAEKFEAMIELGQANSRMKDFYDLWQMSRLFEFDGPTLCRAIRATLSARRTPLDEALPISLSDTFAADASKIAQWQAFLRRSRLVDAEGSWPEIITSLRNWLQPAIEAIRRDTHITGRWHPGSGWR